jgi:putative membrane protein
MMGGYGFGGFGWIGMLFGGLMMLVVVGGLLVLGFVAVRTLAQPGSGQQAPSSGGRSQALEVLQGRYARGEITKEQYETMRRDLSL